MGTRIHDGGVQVSTPASSGAGWTVLQAYTTAGSFSFVATEEQVTAWAAPGAGGGSAGGTGGSGSSANTGGGGGGAGGNCGGSCEELIPVPLLLTVGLTYDVVVGDGGVGGTSAAPGAITTISQGGTVIAAWLNQVFGFGTANYGAEQGTNTNPVGSTGTASGGAGGTATNGNGEGWGRGAIARQTVAATSGGAGGGASAAGATPGTGNANVRRYVANTASTLAVGTGGAGGAANSTRGGGGN